MATIEERLTVIEQDNAKLKHDNADLKQKIELHTLAIGGLVNKSMLEAINDKNDKIFKTLTNHDTFTNQQLADLREKIEVGVEGKVVGMQTEMRQGFDAVNARFEQQDGKIVGMQTEMRQGFDAVNARF